jgi:hypothetical protein
MAKICLRNAPGNADVAQEMKMAAFEKMTTMKAQIEIISKGGQVRTHSARGTPHCTCSYREMMREGHPWGIQTPLPVRYTPCAYAVSYRVAHCQLPQNRTQWSKAGAGSPEVPDFTSKHSVEMNVNSYSTLYSVGQSHRRY